MILAIKFFYIDSYSLVQPRVRPSMRQKHTLVADFLKSQLKILLGDLGFGVMKYVMLKITAQK